MTQPDMTPGVVEPTLVVTVTLSSGGVHVHRLPLSFVERVFGAHANVASARTGADIPESARRRFRVWAMP